jgi:small multidrug resistance pump
MHRTLQIPEPRRTWYRYSFLIAAIYNTIWGVAVILMPGLSLKLAGVSADAVALLFWQCIGMFVMVFAIGYWLCWRDPERYAGFILIALLGKIFGPIGFVYGAFYLDVLPPHLGWTIITNDLLWWPIWMPFVWETIVKRRYEPR